MRLRHLLAAPAALTACLALASPAAAGDPIMPLADVTPGMQCTALSVIRGTTISSFDIEILDVVDGGDPSADSPLILFEASGPAIAGTGIGPGFSGSPIYCPGADGVQRNIGAISQSIGEFGGTAGLATPIESILANPTDPPLPRDAGDGTAASPRAARAIQRMRLEGTKSLAGPLTISGVSPRLGKAIEATGRKYGRPIIAVPAGALGSFPVQTLVPGASVSVGYSGGDVRLGAVGTVAYTDAGNVWSFGHEFEAAGARNLILQDAYVYRVVNDPNASLTGGSYKFAFAGHDVGTLTNDAFSAVVGKVGALPRSTRVTAVGRDYDTGAEKFVETTVADETDVDNPTGFSPLGAVGPIAISQAAGGSMRSAPGRLTGRMCLRITFAERPEPPGPVLQPLPVVDDRRPVPRPARQPDRLQRGERLQHRLRPDRALRGPLAARRVGARRDGDPPRRAPGLPAPGPSPAPDQVGQHGDAARDHAAPARRHVHQALPRAHPARARLRRADAEAQRLPATVGGRGPAGDPLRLRRGGLAVRDPGPRA